MSTQFNLDNNQAGLQLSRRVKVTDLLNRLNEEKKIEKKKFSSRGCSRFCSNCFRHNPYDLVYYFQQFTALSN